MSANIDDDQSPPPFMEEQTSLGLRHRKNPPQAASERPSFPLAKIDSLYAPVSNAKATSGLDASSAGYPLPPSNPSAKSPPTDHSYVESLMGGMRPTEDSKLHGLAISTIDKHFRYFTLWLFCVWASLVVLMYVFVPKESIVPLSGLEQRAAFMSMSLIFISFLSRIIPLLGFGRSGASPLSYLASFNIGGDTASRDEGQGIRKRWETATQSLSGILLGGLSIQIVAILTDFLMAFFPVPVVVDPVLGTRVHVLRWCEWFPCATFMTFMMEGADLFWANDGAVLKEQTHASDTLEKSQHGTQDGPPPDFYKKKFMHAAAQGGAVFLGLMFPFCPGYWTWMCSMVVSCLLYLTNYPRMLQRRSEIPPTLRVGATVEEAERYNSAITALRLRYVCTAVWSIIVALYFISSIGPKFAAEDSILRNPAANMCCECFFDVLSKVLFLVTIMDVHHAIFDPFARSERRLEELRKLMSAVWESSSDPIAISVRTEPHGGVSTLLSPAFFTLGGGRGALRRLSKEEIKNLFWNKSVLFQLSEKVFQRQNDGDSNECCKVKPEDILSVDFTEFSTGFDQSQGVVFAGEVVTPEMGALRAVAESVVKAWQVTGQEPVFSHELSWTRGNNRNVLIYSEAKVSRLDQNSLIVIIRDISERVKVFETEKKILYEATSRQKDAQANRFTRHEVKNGLLAAIGLYETLCEAQRSHLFKDIEGSFGFSLGESDEDTNVVRCMNELGKSLHETLDTIMVEAMTRDLIHDVYRPHRERVDVASVISGSASSFAYDFSSSRNLNRFPLICKPSPLPTFYFDANLLRYLHRQILSNACKYGKTGGVVLTEIIYCDQQKVLRVNVINLPGEFHDKLVAMGSAAEDAVFRKGAQIHEQIIVDSESTVASTAKKTELAALPGDGGWIIEKCAKVMKGQCSIKFLESRTVFTFEVPAKPWGSSEKAKTPIDVKTFRLPNDTWGFAIDDSKIQQKLMVKFFEFAGISSDKIHIFGRNSEEITSFVDFVVDFMGEHMGEHILLIADENLDIVDEAAKHSTISGSLLVESIRLRLLPEQERFLLSLVRSANDSASDIAIYKARAHGFLAKAPIKKGNVLEVLAPLWFSRYPPQGRRMDDDSLNSRRRSDSFSSLESSMSLNEAIASTPVDILSIVNELDKLFASESVVDNWELIREKLHALKGDLLTMQVGSKVIATVGTINSFRANHSHEMLVERWQVLRDQIMSLVST